MTERCAHDRYDFEDDRTLSETVLETIEACRGESAMDADFVLYDDVDPTALDDLFRADATGTTRVRFETDGVLVTLVGNEAVDVRVCQSEPQ